MYVPMLFVQIKSLVLETEDVFHGNMGTGFAWDGIARTGIVHLIVPLGIIECIFCSRISQSDSLLHDRARP